MVKIPHSARERTVRKAWTKAEIEKKWSESNWAKKLAASNVRANLTDFERFKLMRAKQAVIYFCMCFYFLFFHLKMTLK